MSTLTARIRVLFCLLVFVSAGLVAQGPPGAASRPGPVAVHATSPTDLREWDRRINQMVRANQFVVLSSGPDPDIAGRAHETLAQYHQGIPVFGGSLSRQTAQGTSVSIIGTVFEDISVTATAAPRASDVVRALAESVGARPVGISPQLVVFPTLGGEFRLAYVVTLSDIKTYIADAESGSVLWSFDEIQTQSEVGSGTGANGDNKKMSTTPVTGGFRAHDQLRPAQIRTFDTRGSEATLNRLLLPPGATVDGDYSVDGDNTWADPPVVDTHSHSGWMEDYLFKRHNWTGVDNQRSMITATVHSALINNAFFTPPPFGADGRGMFVYGRTLTGAPMTSLDIVAHEMMHGVTNASLVQRTGNGLLSALFVDRYGPTALIYAGSSYPCETTVVTVNGTQLPIFCNAGRYVLASNHPGAINEGFSDVFGISAEFLHHPVGTGTMRADYKMGEDVAGAGMRAADVPGSLVAFSSNLGNMPYPDHASRAFSFALAISSGSRSNPTAVVVLPWVVVGDQLALVSTTDGGGVHVNSTLMSHAFYLAIEGGRNATSGITVQGVGAANRAQIERAFFRAMTVLMPNVPPLPVAAQATYQAAVDLYGASSSAAGAVRQAMQAVGLMN